MEVVPHRKFKKAYKKLKPGEQIKFKERRDLFIKDPFNPILNNHPLYGEYAGYRSIDIAGDLRVHYEPVAPDIALFVNIGTHHELYGK